MLFSAAKNKAGRRKHGKGVPAKVRLFLLQRKTLAGSPVSQLTGF
jgi:hypothetical protein